MLYRPAFYTAHAMTSRTYLTIFLTAANELNTYKTNI